MYVDIMICIVSTYMYMYAYIHIKIHIEYYISACTCIYYICIHVMMYNNFCCTSALWLIIIIINLTLATADSMCSCTAVYS